MSIVQLMARQRLIAERNNMQLQSFRNYDSQRGMLNNPSFMGNLEAASAMESALALENINNECQLMAINAELNALNNAKLNYFA